MKKKSAIAMLMIIGLLPGITACSTAKIENDVQISRGCPDEISEESGDCFISADELITLEEGTPVGAADTDVHESNDADVRQLYAGTDIGAALFGEMFAEIRAQAAVRADVECENTDCENPDCSDPDANAVDVDAEPIEEIEFLRIYNRGTSDKSVAYIQQTLMDLGFMDPAEPTEYYGSVTMEAVKLFQRQNDLKQDGIMGEQTIAMLLNPDAKRYLAKMGMEGSDITRIQQRLYELGYLPSKTYITGKFENETDKAVKALQSANGLGVDGKVGEMTFELMYSDGVVANLMSFGDKGEVILVCQQRLKELGYLTTTPDGNYGSDTLAAVKLFQSRNDLVVDGYLGPSTREALDRSSAVPNGLVIGDEGDTVKRVQKLLIKYGYMNSGSDTGYFGEVTDKAVKSFQKNNGLTSDGNVGVKTMSRLTGDSVVRSDGTGSGSGKVDTGSAKGSVAQLLDVALSKLGCKYVWGAKGPNQFDCSGFVYWCLNQVGVRQSYITSLGWRTVGKYKKISNYKDLKAGDIIVVTGHVGIIGENGTVIDASSSQGKIMHRGLSSWWSSRFIVGWRIFE